jgi:Flp pilus assembly protein TadG
MPRTGNILNKLFGILRQPHGAQLFEFALTLPIMLVVMIGIFDFGQAWNTKQKLANAVREGVRIGASVPQGDIDSTTCANPSASSPCTTQVVADAVKQYMVSAGLDAASCLNPNSPSGNPSFAVWTYTCGGVSMTIERQYLYAATGGATLKGTHVTLSYPYTWTLNRVIGLLPGGGSLSLPSTLTTDGVMQNLN